MAALFCSVAHHTDLMLISVAERVALVALASFASQQPNLLKEAKAWAVPIAGIKLAEMHSAVFQKVTVGLHFLLTTCVLRLTWCCAAIRAVQFGWNKVTWPMVQCPPTALPSTPFQTGTLHIKKKSEGSSTYSGCQLTFQGLITPQGSIALFKGDIKVNTVHINIKCINVKA